MCHIDGDISYQKPLNMSYMLQNSWLKKGYLTCIKTIVLLTTFKSFGENSMLLSKLLFTDFAELK